MIKKINYHYLRFWSWLYKVSLLFVGFLAFLFLQSSCQPQVCKYGAPPTNYLDSVNNSDTNNSFNNIENQHYDSINRPIFNNPTNPQPTKYGVPQKRN